MIQIEMEMPKNCLECRLYKRVPIPETKGLKKQLKELTGSDYRPSCIVTNYWLGDSDRDVSERRGYGCPLRDTQEVVKEAERRIKVLTKAIKECYEPKGEQKK